MLNMYSIYAVAAELYAQYLLAPHVYVASWFLIGSGLLLLESCGLLLGIISRGLPVRYPPVLFPTHPRRSLGFIGALGNVLGDSFMCK
eukprot:scaffold152510_cov29-Attheya_sp.AAC.2